ncbi:glycoside hydrolase family 114 protein [Lentithecium fluviatile CBS 122367]|uniref:alpha-galactosidase n=1 Tax=Lentithecium fluviatile CBS 122367 TaxID=1168545 RepID=A0A6G1IS48_9PLEO|nr:glycoside hydrolase family 114 protein [Lentithecium fluviatile CBS 122367]
MVRQVPLLALALASLCNALPAADLPLSEAVEAERLSISPRQSNYWKPPMKSSIQFILTGIPDVDDGFIKPNTGIYELDMFWTPKETIQKLKELGQRSVCYFSAATAENWRDDYKQFQRQDLGKELPDWPGERYLDIRRDNVLKVIKKRIDLAAEKGCDSIEPDNVDVYSNDNGFTPEIKPDDTVAYLHKLSAYARSKGMSVGIKNCIEILGPIFDDVDFAISEECVQYLNCTAYANFTTAPRPGTEGKPVFEVEYVNYTYTGKWSDDGVALDPSKFRTNNVNFPGLTNEKLRRKLCNLDEPGASLETPYLKINTIIKTLALDGFIMFCDGRVERSRTKDITPGRRDLTGLSGAVGPAFGRKPAREILRTKMPH